jgi:hypothetical protein
MDSVNISLQEYNRLRDFETNILKNNVYKVYVDGFHKNIYSFISENEALKELAELSEQQAIELLDIKRDYGQKITLLMQELAGRKSLIGRIENKMTIWQFIAFKLFNKKPLDQFLK